MKQTVLLIDDRSMRYGLDIYGYIIYYIITSPNRCKWTCKWITAHLACKAVTYIKISSWLMSSMDYMVTT